MTSSTVVKTFETIKNVLYEKYSRNPALMMVHTGTVGWILSSVAHLWNIINSDKFASDEKKFLIPQEALDAIINIGLFYGVTNSCKNLSSKLVSSGKLLSKEVRNYIKINPKNSRLGEFSTNLAKDYEGNGEFFKIYQPFKNGVDLTINTLACIVASNLITPIVRNKIAALRQKQAITKEQTKDNLKTLPNTQIFPNQNKFGLDDYRKQAILNVSHTNASMKI